MPGDNRLSIWRILPLLVLTCALLITIAVYGSTREFSLFFDDTFEVTRIESRTSWQILTQPFPDYGYYRPVMFLIFNTSWELFGEHNTGVLRTLLLLFHALSAWLLYLLVRRLTGSEWAISAAALFLLFPFSYQTVIILGAMGHVLVTMFLLTALLLWTESRYRGWTALQIGAVTCAMLAGWSMEYGVIALPLVFGLELYLRQRMDVPDRADRRPLVLLGLLALAQFLYLMNWLRIDRAESPSPSIADIVQNGVYWMQAATYPGTRFLNLFHSGSEPLAYPVVAATCVGLLAVALLVHAWLGQIRLAVVLLGVAVICFIPSMTMLTHEYVVDSPRLFYVSAPAIVTFWAMLGRGLFAEHRMTIAWRGLATGFVLITLWHSFSMIDRRVEMFKISDSVVAGVVEAGDGAGESPVMMMNVPSWFSFHSRIDQEYPLGHLGVQAIPRYVGLDGLYYAVTGEHVQLESASLAPDVSGGDYAFGPHGHFVDHAFLDDHLRSGYQLARMTIDHDEAVVHQSGHLMVDADVSGSPIAVFGDEIAVQDLQWQSDQGSLVVQSEWHARGMVDADYTIQIEALDSSGDVVLMNRDYALDGMSPPRLWQPGDLILDEVVIPAESLADIASVQLAMINTADDSMMPVSDVVGGYSDGHHVVFEDSMNAE